MATNIFQEYFFILHVYNIELEHRPATYGPRAGSGP